MNTVTKGTQQITLTDNEMKVVNWINQEKIDGNTYLFGEDAEYGAGLPNKIARGSLSSLVKKGLLDVNTQEGGLLTALWD